MRVPGKIYDPVSLLQHWEWDWIDGCFDEAGQRFMPTDVDGLIERRGHFLIIETKGVDVPIPRGQKIALERLVDSLSRKSALMVLWGEKDTPRVMQVRWRRRWSPPTICDARTVRERVRRWFVYASSPPPRSDN